jgi:hypothetical protein
MIFHLGIDPLSLATVLVVTKAVKIEEEDLSAYYAFDKLLRVSSSM